MTPSVSKRLIGRIAAIGGAAAFALLLFVGFNIDQVFDSRYLGITGLAYEIGDHVVLPALVLLLPLMLATPWIVRQALAPLGVAADRIDAASGQDRGFRVGLDGLPVEAVPFAAAVNNLLRRLDDAAERQEAFAADIAHELKTPLSILALELSIYGDPLAGKIKADVARMNRLIDQLLLIAQLDADAAARTAHDRVDLREVAEEVTARLAPMAIAGGRRVALEILDEPVVHGRREAIAAALRNLIENALRVTGPDGAVTTTVGPGPRLSVQDEGPGLTAGQLTRLVNRLSRADHASTDGAGLGLSIVSKIAASHGAALETLPDRRQLQLVFPATPRPRV
jgi:two-component system, OmpR family, sensor kinase